MSESFQEQIAAALSDENVAKDIRDAMEPPGPWSAPKRGRTARPKWFRAFKQRLMARLAPLCAQVEQDIEDTAAMQADLRRILEAIGVPVVAKPYSPHECVTRDVLPSIQKLREAEAALAACQQERDDLLIERSATRRQLADAQRELQEAKDRYALARMRGFPLPHEEPKETT